jgi:hypothetical protein
MYFLNTMVVHVTNKTLGRFSSTPQVTESAPSNSSCDTVMNTGRIVYRVSWKSYTLFKSRWKESYTHRHKYTIRFLLFF